MHPKVAAALKGSSFSYRVHYHDKVSTPIGSPEDFAQSLGYDPERITKSLFVSSIAGAAYGVAVCSVKKRLNLQAIAIQLGCSRVQIAKLDILARELGYPVMGVSPIIAGDIPIFLDERLFIFDTILIGGGEVGVEIEIAPQVLKELTNAIVSDFVM